jgi:hypothetical protein
LFLASSLIESENLLRSINSGRHAQSKEAEMRHLAAVAAALGLAALALTPSGPAGAAEQEPTARLLTFKESSAPDQRAAPVILRGSAIGPRRAAEVSPGAQQVQIAGGRRLWMLDPVNQEVRVCTLVNTPDVGVEEIVCVRASLQPVSQGPGRALRGDSGAGGLRVRWGPTAAQLLARRHCPQDRGATAWTADPPSARTRTVTTIRASV